MTKKDYDEIRNEILPCGDEIEFELSDELYTIYPLRLDNHDTLRLQRINMKRGFEVLFESDFDFQDGVSKQAIEKLFSAPCFDGKSIDDLKDEIKIIGIR